MEFVEPGVELDYLLDSPGGRLLELAPVEDVDEAPRDDSYSGLFLLFLASPGPYPPVSASEAAIEL